MRKRPIHLAMSRQWLLLLLWSSILRRIPKRLAVSWECSPAHADHDHPVHRALATAVHMGVRALLAAAPLAQQVLSLAVRTGALAPFRVEQLRREWMPVPRQMPNQRQR